MHKLLIPVDGSENAARAVQYALKLAKENKAIELHLVTVHPEPAIYGEIQVYVSKERMEELQRKHSEDALGPPTEAAKSAGVPYTSEILVGDTAQMIVNKANEIHADGIVMGTRGMGVIGNLVMGSVATKVIHLANIPVTLVK